MNILFGYLGFSEHAIRWHESAVERARSFGHDVKAFCLSPDPPQARFPWSELDTKWRRRDRALCALRSRLAAALEDRDVFWNFNGVNVHPEWLKDFKTMNVYGCFDDPESSSVVSAPVARYYDAAFVGNLSCLPQYEGWGMKRVAWCPIGLIGDDYDPALTPEQIRREERPLSAVFIGERENPWRRNRLDLLVTHFPDAMFRGKGWPEGAIHEECANIYRKTRIGWNVHNSIGPINVRLFALLANGVLQICDNRCRLGTLLKLEEEVIGFDDMYDCIDRTRYFLTHDRERREIAANGFRRYTEDYSEPRLWEYFSRTFSGWLDSGLGSTERGGAFERLVWDAGTVRSRRHFATSATSSANRILAPLGVCIVRKTSSSARDNREKESSQISAYMENPEAGPVNMAKKKQRVEQGGCFEWPNIVALNWAVARMVGDSRSIVELGGGTGCFAHEAAADPRRRIVCADGDADAINWARKHRARPNIDYRDSHIEAGEASFDLSVAIELIEHVKDYRFFLGLLGTLAPETLITTPNRLRSKETTHAGPPNYYQHVREWSAGEFYWVLRSFWKEVELYAMPDVYIPDYTPISIDSKLTPLIARCRHPFVAA